MPNPLPRGTYRLKASPLVVKDLAEHLKHSSDPLVAFHYYPGWFSLHVNLCSSKPLATIKHDIGLKLTIAFYEYNRDKRGREAAAILARRKEDPKRSAALILRMLKPEMPHLTLDRVKDVLHRRPKSGER